MKDEIKKALKCCISSLCVECPFKAINCDEKVPMAFALDLINHYEAEIKRLEDAKNAYKDIVDTCEIGAIKKFAEKVNENRIKYFNYIYTDDGFREITNNILKSMGVNE